MKRSREVFEAAACAAVQAYEQRLGIAWAEPRPFASLRPEEKDVATAQVRAVLAVLARTGASPAAVLVAADEEDEDEVGTD